MKHLFLFILGCLIVCPSAYSSELTSIEKAKLYRSELVRKQDELLELLLQIPFEQRQYIFPMLSSERTMPKKIRTHPEVVVWKGKIPTRIADRFKGDTEFIQYLPEQFYYFLAPEVWPSQEEENAEINPNQILKNMISTNNAPLLSTPVIPEELVDIYAGLKILQQYQNNNLSSPLYFKQWLNHLPKSVANEILQKTGLPLDQFGEKLDEIAQNYRIYQKGKIPASNPNQQLVQNYLSMIPFIFQKTGFQMALDPKLYQD